MDDNFLENLVQNGITPERWVNKWGEWTVKPEVSPIKTDLIQDVVAKTKQIANNFGSDIDVEWVYDGNSIHWVQLREITSLNDSSLYSNHIAREVFPGMIKPLIWSVNVPLVCPVTNSPDGPLRVGEGDRKTAAGSTPVCDDDTGNTERI